MTIHVPTPTTRPPAKEMWFLDGYVRVHASKGDNADGISVLEHWMPPGFGPPLHVHHDEDEVFYVLEGALRFQIGEETRVLDAGDALTAPRGVPHGFVVISPGGGRAITVTRGGFEALVRAASRPAPGPRLPPRMTPTPAMRAALAAACSANGIDLLGPPIG